MMDLETVLCMLQNDFHMWVGFRFLTSPFNSTLFLNLLSPAPPVMCMGHVWLHKAMEINMDDDGINLDEHG